jgi:hypothetical protein
LLKKRGAVSNTAKMKIKSYSEISFRGDTGMGIQSGVSNMYYQGKARQGKARQGKARQDKAIFNISVNNMSEKFSSQWTKVK